jgi:phosphoglycerate dehydrogenase-like enzyme
VVAVIPGILPFGSRDGSPFQRHARTDHCFGSFTLTRGSGGTKLRILVWGLGYVGSVTAGCLAHLGYEVVGIEPNETRIARVNSGRSPVKKPGLDSLVSTAIVDKRLQEILPF